MPNKFGQFKNIAYLCTRFSSTDPLAQLVEHNTFNVGVLGSSPKRITEKRLISLFFCYIIIFLYLSLVVCRKISTFADKACKPNKKTNKYYNHSMIYVSL